MFGYLRLFIVVITGVLPFLEVTPADGTRPGCRMENPSARSGSSAGGVAAALRDPARAPPHAKSRGERAAASGPRAGAGTAGAPPAARGGRGPRGGDEGRANPPRRESALRSAALRSRPGARGRVPPARRTRVAPLPARGSAPRFPGLSRPLRARHSNVLRGAGCGASRHWPLRHSPMGVRAPHWPGAAVRQRAAECVRLG